MDTQKLLSYLRQCIQKYNMIKTGDHIAVGLSGGKDSMTLLYGLKQLQRFYPEHFELSAIYVNLGIPVPDTPIHKPQTLSDAVTILSNYCKGLEVPFYVVGTDIYQITFEERKEKNPCSLCSKMRKGALNNQALELGCNKIAYAHHKDDFIETSLMSLLFEGHYYCFPPVTHLDRTGLTVIRPMLYIDEREISGFVKRKKIPVAANPCPADGVTTRQQIKEFIQKNAAQFPDIRKNLNAALLDYFEKNPQ
ncbi:MAG: tRNA 2-thiocytidine biosynthesis TtcA family protein [Lachnospiraceae bacterium]|nr:tRNA 2-thiocytidine biosynthesis TtcA family protein [Lachnospiraceae bacterium]